MTRQGTLKLLKEAKEIEKAGAFSIVIECISPNAAKLITRELVIPTIGIGSSSYCDGQILVTDDMLGISGFYPKFVKKYANLNRIIEKAVKKYTRDVKLKKFPSIKNFLNGTKNRN
jgi:3-methyl-2-oxobutanoate hydroxymethyltransferase